jgi:hypothetical protein
MDTNSNKLETIEKGGFYLSGHTKNTVPLDEDSRECTVLHEEVLKTLHKGTSKVLNKAEHLASLEQEDSTLQDPILLW